MRDDLSLAQWRKSSYSGNSGNCVEVAITGSLIGIRDSKNPSGPTLMVTREYWREFLATVKSLQA